MTVSARCAAQAVGGLTLPGVGGSGETRGCHAAVPAVPGLLVHCPTNHSSLTEEECRVVLGQSANVLAARRRR